MLVMQKGNTLRRRTSIHIGNNLGGKVDSRFPCTISILLSARTHVKPFCIRAKLSSTGKVKSLGCTKTSHDLQSRQINGVAGEDLAQLSDEDDDLCPVECVREFKTNEELFKILEKAKETDSLVVVDFYRTSCGSCKYIEHGFSKLCKGSGDQEAPVIFLKHNVIDEYDEQSEVAERLRIKTVPLFHFYKNGVLLEAFATRDKERIDAAILKYTSSTSPADLS